MPMFPVDPFELKIAALRHSTYRTISGDTFYKVARRLTGLAVLLPLVMPVMAAAKSDPALIPYPREVRPGSGSLLMARSLTIGTDNDEDRFAAGMLVRELRDIEHVHASVQNMSLTDKIVLVRQDTSLGRRILRNAGLELPLAAQKEGYALVVNERQAAVVAGSSAGIFYGVQTLRQLMRPSSIGAKLPAVTIMDWPAFNWRGSQISLSQGAVPTQQDIERAIRLLAAYKQNLLMLYFENTFDYTSMPLNAPPIAGMTPAEARELVSYAQRYHIIIIPEQESLGHLHQILYNEKYKNITEVPYGTVIAPGKPESLQLVTQMLSELVQVFPGPFLHIGADETFELGQGRTKHLAEQEGLGQVYVGFMKKIDVAMSYAGRKIIFWGDIAQHYPELLNQIPRNMIAMPWNYHALTDKQFAAMIAPFRNAGLETWIAPGVDNWNNIFPNYTIALPNIRVFAEAGRPMGVTGMMNTTWNDDGESLFDATWYGLTYGAAVSWQETMDDARFGQSYDWAFYRATGHHFQQQIEDMTQIYTVLHTVIPQDGTDRLVWNDPFTPDGQKLYLKMQPAASQMRLLAEQVIESVRTNRPLAKQNTDLLDYVELGARRFDYLGQKSIYAKYIVDLYRSAQQNQTSNPSAVLDVLDRIAASDGLLLDLRNRDSCLMESYRSQWLAGNRPYFMDNMLLHYQLENLRIAQQIDRFRTIRQDYPDTHCLPPLISPQHDVCPK